LRTSIINFDRESTMNWSFLGILLSVGRLSVLAHRHRTVVARRRKRGLRVPVSRWGLLLPALLDGRHVVVLLEILKEVADVEEGVGITPDIHEGRLHAGQHACDSALVNASD
jgi:hypothetical protein